MVSNSNAHFAPGITVSLRPKSRIGHNMYYHNYRTAFFKCVFHDVVRKSIRFYIVRFPFQTGNYAIHITLSYYKSR